MKLTIIHPTDPLGQKVGGVEVFLKGFIKWAPPDFGIRFVGISSDREKRPPGRWVSLNLGDKEVEFFPLFFEKDENRKTLIPLSLRFTCALKFARIDFSNDMLFFNRLEPTVVFRNVKVPKILVIHNDITKQILQKKSELLWSKFPALYFIFARLTIPSLDIIYTVSLNTLEVYKTKFKNDKCKFSFLSTFVDKMQFHSTEEPKKNVRQKLLSINKFLPLGKKWVLFVGRLQIQKAPFRLVDAFLQYYKKEMFSCLIIIGEGNLKTSLEKYIKKLGMEKNIFILENMKQNQLADFYRASDVLLLASNFEGMPLCVLEALSCGLPVVSTDVGEVRRVLKNGFSGEVLEIFSPKSVATAIKKVLSNSVVYSKNNCVNAVSEYTPKRVLKPVYETIKRLYEKGCVIE